MAYWARERLLPATAGALHFSGTAEADGHFAVFDDHRDLAAAFGVPQHLGQRLIVFEHVAVFEGNFFAREGLPGRGGVGSKLFAENYYGVRHVIPSRRASATVKNRRAAAKLQVNRTLC
jgi:hypothetical protein